MYPPTATLDEIIAKAFDVVTPVERKLIVLYLWTYLEMHNLLTPTVDHRSSMAGVSLRLAYCRALEEIERNSRMLIIKFVAEQLELGDHYFHPTLDIKAKLTTSQGIQKLQEAIELFEVA